MTKGQHGNRMSEKANPALEPHEQSLRVASDQATRVSAGISEAVRQPHPLAGLAKKIESLENQDIRALCSQKIWISFFFDGTGNNMEADLYLNKHSNIVKLFRVHPPLDAVKGIYSVYIPGIGTLFPEIGDDGGNKAGLGCGKFGEKRLRFALERFDSIVAEQVKQARSNSAKINEVNITVFGFSRGAALARAFVNLFIEERCVRVVRHSSICRLTYEC